MEITQFLPTQKTLWNVRLLCLFPFSKYYEKAALKRLGASGESDSGQFWIVSLHIVKKGWIGIVFCLWSKRIFINKINRMESTFKFSKDCWSGFVETRPWRMKENWCNERLKTSCNISFTSLCSKLLRILVQSASLDGLSPLLCVLKIKCETGRLDECHLQKPSSFCWLLCRSPVLPVCAELSGILGFSGSRGPRLSSSLLMRGWGWGSGASWTWACTLLARGTGAV